MRVDDMLVNGGAIAGDDYSHFGLLLRRFVLEAVLIVVALSKAPDDARWWFYRYMICCCCKIKVFFRIFCLDKKDHLPLAKIELLLLSLMESKHRRQ